MKIFKVALTLMLLAVCHITPNLAFAQYFHGPVSQGIGGAGRAANEVGEQFILNPAALPHAPSLTSSLFYEGGDTAENESRSGYGVTFVDNTEEIFFPGGFAYINSTKRQSGIRLEENFMQASLGNFLLSQLSMGFSVVRLAQNYEVSGLGTDKYEQWNGVVGLLYSPTPDWGLGAIYYHFMEAKDDIPDSIALVPQLSLSGNYILSRYFQARLDFSQAHRFNPDREWQIQAGVESAITRFLRIRFGADWDDFRRRHYLTGGLTFDGPRLKIDYSISKNAREGTGALHGVDLRVGF